MHAAAGRRLPRLLQWGQSAYEFAAVVAAARAHMPRCDSFPMVAVNTSDGRRRDGSRLDLLCLPPYTFFSAKW